MFREQYLAPLGPFTNLNSIVHSLIKHQLCAGTYLGAEESLMSQTESPCFHRVYPRDERWERRLTKETNLEANSRGKWSAMKKIKAGWCVREWPEVGTRLWSSGIWPRPCTHTHPGVPQLLPAARFPFISQRAPASPFSIAYRYQLLKSKWASSVTKHNQNAKDQNQCLTKSSGTRPARSDSEEVPCQL